MNQDVEDRNLVAPTGARIAGTLERLTGLAEVSSVTRDADGAVQVEFGGGTEVYWNDQKTETCNGEIVFIDEDGEEWLESQLVDPASLETDGE